MGEAGNARMSREEILGLMQFILRKQGKEAELAPTTSLRAIGFRSLDFSELALRVENRLGAELVFDASLLRRIETVADVLDFFEKASAGA